MSIRKEYQGEGRLILVVSVMALAAWLAACSGSDGGPADPDPEPQTGFVQVSTSTAGADLDPDGYTVTMAGSSDRSIGLNGVATFVDIATGQHQVELTGIADNCSVTGPNPTAASVTGGATAEVSFDVTCNALPIGSLEVTTTVTNNFDPDGYQVSVGGTFRGRVDVDGSATFDDLPAGAQEVELREIAPNCSVDGAHPATVTIPIGGSATHAFAVTCVSPPDGRIVYQGVLAGREGLIVMNSDGSGRTLIFEGGPTRRLRRPRWSPDGSRIAFVMYDPTGSNDYREVFTVNQDGSELTQMTSDNGYADNPAWSPDGAQIGFDYGSECCGGTLYTVNPDGTDIAEIPRDQPLFREDSPNWSPDGSQIVFFGMEEDYLEPGIFVMDALGGTAVQISADPPTCDGSEELAWHDGAYWGRPVWSPDGGRIVFARTFHCPPEGGGTTTDLFIMNSDGSAVTNLTDRPGWAILPDWSPDGSKIVFDGGDWSIRVINADGTGETQIIPPGNVAVSDPDWGP